MTSTKDNFDWELLFSILKEWASNFKILEIIKPLCEVYETPKRHDMFLKVKGVVVYQFQLREQFNLFKEWLENDK